MLNEMRKRALFLIALVLLALSAAIPAFADTQFRVRKMTRDDIPLGKGQCDIQLQVDSEAEITVRRDTVLVHTISGREPRDEGSECNAPLPDRDNVGFEFQVSERRNEIVLLAEPSRRNNFSAVVRIRDSSGGEGRYRFRLTWQMTGGDDFDRPGRGPTADERRGIPEDRRVVPEPSWNGDIRFSGPGRGSSTLTSYGNQQLTSASVEIERGGRVTVSFRGETERPLTFTGTVVSRQGPQYRADVTTEDHRFRGPMFFTIVGRDEVRAVRFEGSDNFGHLQLSWERR